MERKKEQMMRGKEELMLRLQDYEENTREAEKELSDQIQRALKLEEERKRAQEGAGRLEADSAKEELEEQAADQMRARSSWPRSSPSTRPRSPSWRRRGGAGRASWKSGSSGPRRPRMTW